MADKQSVEKVAPVPHESKCPPHTKLELFALHQLSADSASSIRHHLEMCDFCSDTLSHLQRPDETFSEAPTRYMEHADDPSSPPAHPPTLQIDESSLVDGTPPPAVNSDSPNSRILRERLSFLSPPEQPGQLGTLGPYRILNILGMGGMGIVFKAEDPQLRRQIALKVIKPNFAEQDEAKQRFLREAQAVAALSHDNIIAIYQVGEDRVPFLAMPLLEGESLADRLEREGRLPLELTLQITCQIALGLDAAHKRGVIHRDIKPANIWLEEESNRVKLLDFGLARAADADMSLTATGTIAGTPEYMSPEQAAADEVDARSDLFSLGCVLYRLFRGATPFAGPTALSVLSALANRTPQPLHEIADGIPHELSELVMRLLEKDPDNRCQSAGEVVARIERIQQSLESADEDLLPKVQIKKSTVKRPSIFTSIAAVTVVATALLVAAVVFIIQTPRGTVRIESKDDNVEVAIKQGGKVVEVVDADDGWTVRLKEGHYKVELRDTTDQFKVDGKGMLEVIRGQESLVNIVLKDLAKPAVTSSPTTAAPVIAEANYALQFDGTANYVNVDDWFEVGSEFTLEATVESWGMTGSNTQILSGIAGFSYQIIQDKSDNKRGFLQTGIATESGSVVVCRSRMSFHKTVRLATVYDGTSMKLFINGRMVRKNEFKEKATKRISPSFGMMYPTSTSSTPFYGLIDEVRYSKVARYDGDYTPQARLEADSDTVALYHFDEGKGDVLTDSSGNGHDGNIVDAKWVNVNGSPLPHSRKSALSFDGQTSGVRVQKISFDGTRPFTIEAWVTPFDTPDDPTPDIVASLPSIMAIHLDRQRGWRATRHSSEGRSHGVYADRPAKLAQRAHVATVWDGQRLLLYVDGKRQGVGAEVPNGISKPIVLLIGGGHGQSRFSFHGVIDELCLSQVARYTRNFSPRNRFESDEHTLALYHFEAGQGEVLTDSSGNGHDGKIAGAKWVQQ